MKKIEEFNKTQMLIDEFKKLKDRGPELDNQIDQLNRRTNLTIERLEEEMKPSWEDVEFNLDRRRIENRNYCVFG